MLDLHIFAMSTTSLNNAKYDAAGFRHRQDAEDFGCLPGAHEDKVSADCREDRGGGVADRDAGLLRFASKVACRAVHWRCMEHSAIMLVCTGCSDDKRREYRRHGHIRSQNGPYSMLETGEIGSL